ncbi:MAG: hypothetical protein ACLFR0_03445 [Alphaproteobacteria bacterium]
MDFLKRLFDSLQAGAEPIAIEDLPCGEDSMHAHIIMAIYSQALEKGLFEQGNEERLKTTFRNLRLQYGEDVFSEARIEATIDCIRDACADFADIQRKTEHQSSRQALQAHPEIWR